MSRTKLVQWLVVLLLGITMAMLAYPSAKQISGIAGIILGFMVGTIFGHGLALSEVGSNKASKEGDGKA